MLVLSRKLREAVVVGGGRGTDPQLKITVLEIAGSRVKLGFEGGSDFLVQRMEIMDRRVANGCDASCGGKDPLQNRTQNTSSVTGGMLGMVALIAEERKQQNRSHGQNGDSP